MQTLRHPLFWGCIILFCLNQLLELSGNYIWPLHAYLDDLVCLPLVLTIALAAERAYFHNPAFVFPIRYIAGAVVAFSVVFELLLPPFSGRHTTDVFDVPLYLLGALAFHFVLNKPLP